MREDDVAALALTGIELHAAVLNSPACGHVFLAVAAPAIERLSVKDADESVLVLGEADILALLSLYACRHAESHFLGTAA